MMDKKDHIAAREERSIAKLRDQFAMAALVGMAANTTKAKAAATWAYEYADAMLAERDK